jgi:predicted helicase
MKLEIKKSFANERMQLQTLQPNSHGDWISHRNVKFSEYIPLIPEKKLEAKPQSFFIIYSNGLKTNRDAWIYNGSKKGIEDNIIRTINSYNEQLSKLIDLKKKGVQVNIDNFVDYDATKIAWTLALKNNLNMY